MRTLVKHITRKISCLYVCSYSFIYLLCMVTAVCGWEKYVVTSGSMMPALTVGSCIWVRKTIPQNLKEDDIISFTLSESDTVVTHRIIAQNTENGIVQTKGDANERPDAAFVPYENILGKVVLHIPFFGQILLFLSDPSGKTASVSFLILCFGLLWLTQPESSHVRKVKKRYGKA